MPINRGGSYQYSIVEVVISENAKIDEINKLFSVSKDGQLTSKKLYFLTETNKYAYFAPFKIKMAPRDLFGYLLSNNVFAIDRSLIQFVKYDTLVKTQNYDVQPRSAPADLADFWMDTNYKIHPTSFVGG